MSIHQSIIAAEFNAASGDSHENYENRVLSSVSELRKYVDLILHCEDERGQDVLLPPLRVPIERLCGAGDCIGINRDQGQEGLISGVLKLLFGRRKEAP